MHFLGFAAAALLLLIVHPRARAQAQSTQPPSTQTPTAQDIGWFTDADLLTVPEKDRSFVQFRYVLYEHEAKSLFRELAARQDIAFKYPDDGCYARAQEMAKMLEEQGIIASKVFIEGDLKVLTLDNPEGFVKWAWHVAPVVMVRTDFGDLPMVFDPSLFDEPTSLQEWVALQIRHNPKQALKLYYRSRYTYGPGPEQDGWSQSDMDDAKSTMADYLKIQRERAKKRKKPSVASSLTPSI